MAGGGGPAAGEGQVPLNRGHPDSPDFRQGVGSGCAGPGRNKGAFDPAAHPQPRGQIDPGDLIVGRGSLIFRCDLNACELRALDSGSEKAGIAKGIDERVEQGNRCGVLLANNE